MSLGNPLKGWLLALAAHIRLDWKGLPSTNTVVKHCISVAVNYSCKKFYNIGLTGLVKKIKN